MNICIRLLLSTILLLSFVVARADRGGFVIKDYNVDATVDANNTWHVKETILVDFESPRHGIYRYLKETFYQNLMLANSDGILTKTNIGYSADISDINVEGYKFKTKSEDNNEIIIIGDPDYEVSGLQKYVISYTYAYPDDRIGDRDFLFHSIHGADWDAPVEHFSFNIQFAKDLPEDLNLIVYQGAYGSTTESENVDVYLTTPSTLTGEVVDINPNEAVTLYADLPEGFFTTEKAGNFWAQLFFYLSLIILGVIAFYELTTKQRHATKSIEFYPPEGISSAEVGVIIDETVDDIDLGSLIPWFASQGYLTIREVEKPKVLGIKRSTLELVCTKGLPADAPEYQKTFWEALFGTKKVVRLDSLPEKPQTIENCKKELSGVYSGEKALTQTHDAVWLFVLLFLTSTLAMLFSNPVAIFTWDNLLFVGLAWSLPFLVAGFWVFGAGSSRFFGVGFKQIFFIALRLLLVIVNAASWMGIFFEYGSLLAEWQCLALYGCCFVAFEFINRLDVDTEYRIQLMGKLMGLREFIKTAELHQLEALQQEDPQYFYRVLPYALVFDLSDKWAKQFKEITVEKPEWYESDLGTGFMMSNMVNTLHTSTRSAITTVSHDSSSSSGGGGGGGFSGGGGGGGGGGSW